MTEAPEFQKRLMGDFFRGSKEGIPHTSQILQNLVPLCTICTILVLSLPCFASWVALSEATLCSSMEPGRIESEPSRAGLMSPNSHSSVDSVDTNAHYGNALYVSYHIVSYHIRYQDIMNYYDMHVHT
jgi:hypothetical protein